MQSLGLMTTVAKARGGRLEVGRGGSEEGRLPHTSVPALLSARPPPVAWRHLLPMPKRETRGDSLFFSRPRVCVTKVGREGRGKPARLFETGGRRRRRMGEGEGRGMGLPSLLKLLWLAV